MPDPIPSGDTVTLTVTYSQMQAPHVMTPVSRLAGPPPETDEALSKRAAGYAADYGVAGSFGKLQSITAEWT